MSATPSQPNDPGVPVEYAGADTILDRPPAKSPRWPLGLAVASGVLLSLLFVATLLDTNGSILTVTLPAWPLSLAAVVSAVIAIRRNADSRLPANEQRTGARVWTIFAFSIVVLLVYTGMAGHALAHLRVVGKSVMTAAHLRYLGLAIQKYGQEDGVWPPDFDVLVATRVSIPLDLVSSSDSTPTASNPPSGPPWYTSFVYRPGVGKPVSDPALVIAFERMPWSPKDTRLLTKWARWVLFGDNRVQLLDDGGFKSALRRDAERRRELGWPVPPAP